MRVSEGSAETIPAADEPLYTLHPLAIWRELKRQPASFWWINIYLLFEYVRPQSVYSFLEGPPWTKMTILLALGSFLYEGKMFGGRTAADLALAFFTLILTLSSITAANSAVSYDRIPEFYSWVLIYLLITNIVNTERRFLIFFFAFLLYSFKMSQHATRDWASAGFAFRDWGVSGAPGWFHNSGEYGVQMTIYVPLAIYFVVALRKHWGRKMRAFLYLLPLTGIIGTIGSSSRGAMLGLGVAILFMVAKTQYKAKGAAGLIAVGLIGWFFLPEESADRFRSMGEDDTSNSRKLYWALGIKLMNEFPVLGIGFNNWLTYTRSIGERVALPHNIFIEAGAELGYLGLFALIGMLVATFVVNAQSRKILKPIGERGDFLSSISHGLEAGLVGYMVSGFFVTVLYYPFLWINLALTVALHSAARHLVEQQKSMPGGPERTPIHGSPQTRRSIQRPPQPKGPPPKGPLLSPPLRPAQPPIQRSPGIYPPPPRPA